MQHPLQAHLDKPVDEPTNAVKSSKALLYPLLFHLYPPNGNPKTKKQIIPT
jgi:hypothetical protein